MQGELARLQSEVELLQKENEQLRAPGHRIFVKTLDSLVIHLFVKPGMTVWNVKEALQARGHGDASEMRLISRRLQLRDEKTVRDYDIGANETLHLIMKMRGD